MKSQYPHLFPFTLPLALDKKFLMVYSCCDIMCVLDIPIISLHYACSCETCVLKEKSLHA